MKWLMTTSVVCFLIAGIELRLGVRKMLKVEVYRETFLIGYQAFDGFSM